MTKMSALPAAFWVGTKDISGDVGALSSMDSSINLFDDSGIDKEGTERLQLRSDGEFSYTAFWNPSSGQSVPVLSDLDGATTLCTAALNVGLGAYAASLLAKKVKFTAALGQDGSLVANGQVMGSDGVPIEWGRLLTIGKQTFASTGAIASWQATHNYSVNDLVQPTTPNGRYYKATADTGSSDVSEPTWPTVTGNTVVDDGITWTDQGLLPNGIDRGVGSATSFGMAVYMHVFSIGSGNATLTVQDSGDRVAWDDVPLAVFSGITGATTGHVVTALNENVRRYVRVLPTGTFTNLVAAVNAVPYIRDHS